MDKENQLPDKRGDASEAHLMQDTTEERNEENDSDLAQSVSSQETIEQLPIIAFLSKELAKSKIEILRLKAKINCNESQSTADEEETDIVNQRNELLKLLSIRDNAIERMSIVINTLETQLQAAVSEKFDALARLDAVGGKELTVLFEKSQTEMFDERSKHLKQGFKSKETTQHEINNATDHRSDAPNQGKRSRKDTQIQSSNEDALEAAYSEYSQQDEVIDILSAESDQEASLSNRENNEDSVSIQDELLSLVRTRRQNQFLLDAFNGCGKIVSEDSTTPNGKKARVQKPSSSTYKTSSAGRSPRGCVVKLRKVKFDD